MSTQRIQLEDVSFSFGRQIILDRFTTGWEAGSITALLGASGCGKSTLLKLIAGLELAEIGQISTSSPGGPDRLGMLFQDYDAFPWFTVWHNLKFSALGQRQPTSKEIEQMLRAVGLWTSRHKYPAQLSGGMRKRLSLARTLITRPTLLLLDEPFSRLDVDTKVEMYQLLQELWLEFHPTIILVTHDVHEAILLASTVQVASGPPLAIQDQIPVGLPYPRNDEIVALPNYKTTSIRVRESLRNSFAGLKSDQ